MPHGKLSLCLQIYAPEHALKGGHLYDDWDPDLAQSLVNGMTPRAARLDLQTRAFDALSERIQQVSLMHQACACSEECLRLRRSPKLHRDLALKMSRSRTAVC